MGARVSGKQAGPRSPHVGVMPISQATKKKTCRTQKHSSNRHQIEEKQFWRRRTLTVDKITSSGRNRQRMCVFALLGAGTQVVFDHSTRNAVKFPTRELHSVTPFHVLGVHEPALA